MSEQTRDCMAPATRAPEQTRDCMAPATRAPATRNVERCVACQREIDNGCVSLLLHTPGRLPDKREAYPTFNQQPATAMPLIETKKGRVRGPVLRKSCDENRSLFLVVVCRCILLGGQQNSFPGQLHAVLVIDCDDLHFKRIANLADV